MNDESHSSSREDVDDPPLRPCQVDCLGACGKGARIIEMACGTGKTRVIKELAGNVSGRVSRLMLSLCHVGSQLAMNAFLLLFRF